MFLSLRPSSFCVSFFFLYLPDIFRLFPPSLLLAFEGVF